MATKAKRSKKKSVGSKAGGAKKRSRAGGTLVRWTSADDKTLKQMVKQGTSTRVIGGKLKRSEGSVRQHAYKLGLSLKKK